MTNDMEEVVRQGYEQGDYSGYAQRELPVLDAIMMDIFLGYVREGGALLDLGCAYGIPYDNVLAARGYRVTGIDLVERHIEEARNNVPCATYIVGDYTKHMFDGRFDGIVSFYSIFNVPREEHGRLFRRMNSLLVADGPMLITLGAADMERSVTDFIGSKMAWSSYSADMNRKLVEDAGFRIVMEVNDKRGTNHHQWIMGRKNG